MMRVQLIHLALLRLAAAGPDIEVFHIVQPCTYYRNILYLSLSLYFLMNDPHKTVHKVKGRIFSNINSLKIESQRL